MMIQSMIIEERDGDLEERDGDFYLVAMTTANLEDLDLILDGVHIGTLVYYECLAYKIYLEGERDEEGEWYEEDVLRAYLHQTRWANFDDHKITMI